MVQTIMDALSQGNFVSDEQEYVIVKLPPRAITLGASIIAENANPFSALIVDKDEVSLLINKEAVRDFEERLRDHTISKSVYRLITFDATLDFDLVGFMAELSGALADAGVSILTYGSYSRDHFLVPCDKFSQAMTALERLKNAK